MSERTNITNFLLLSVLAGILLVSGSLQCAFDCLTQAGSQHSVSSLQSLSNRIDTCHPSLDNVPTTVSCVNKACHERLPHHRNLDGPEIYHLGNLAQPLYSSSRQQSPQFRAGSTFELPKTNLKPESRLQATASTDIQKTHFSIRTTVILC